MWSYSRDKQRSYKHLPAVGAFSLKFSIAIAAKLLTGSKKVRGNGAKMGRTSSITMTSMVGIVRHAPAVDEKVWCVFCLFVTLGITKFVITETLWSSVIFKTIMVSLHAGRFVVVHFPHFNFFCGPPEFFLRGKYQKLPFFAITLLKVGSSNSREHWTVSLSVS